jgi:hypothetical protein
MKLIYRLLFLCLLAACSAQTSAQDANRPGNSNIRLAQANGGSSFSPAGKTWLTDMVTALQAAGFQAVPPAAALPPALTRAVVGIVQTGVDGWKVLVTAFRCPNDPVDEVCSTSLFVFFDDTKKNVNGDFLARANSQTTFVKITGSHKPNGDPTLMIVSQVFCKGFDYSKMIPQFLPVFGAEVAKVLALYNERPST